MAPHRLWWLAYCWPETGSHHIHLLPMGSACLVVSLRRTKSYPSALSTCRQGKNHVTLGISSVPAVQASEASMPPVFVQSALLVSRLRQGTPAKERFLAGSRGRNGPCTTDSKIPLCFAHLPATQPQPVAPTICLCLPEGSWPEQAEDHFNARASTTNKQQNGGDVG